MELTFFVTLVSFSFPGIFMPLHKNLFVSVTKTIHKPTLTAFRLFLLRSYGPNCSRHKFLEVGMILALCPWLMHRLNLVNRRFKNGKNNSTRVYAD